MTPTPTFHSYLRSAGAIDMPPGLPDFPMAFTPRKHQVDGLYHLLRNSRWGLFDDAGVGKTCPLHASMLYRIGYGEKVIVLMPPALIYQFTRSLYDVYLGTEGKVICADLTKPKATRDRMQAGWDEAGVWPHILMMSYAMFLKYRATVRDRGYRIMVCDEAQNLRGSDSKIHGAVYDHTLNEDSSALVLSTGTPIHNTMMDAFGMTRLLDRDAYYSLDSFQRRHCVIQRGFAMVNKKLRNGGVKQIQVQTEKVVDFKGLPAIRSALYKFASRATKEEVLNLADPVIVLQDILMHSQHRAMYRKMLKTRMLRLELEGEGRSILLTAELEVQLREYLMQIACTPDDYSESGKPIKNALLDAAIDLRDAIDPSRKVLMFAYHQRTVEVAHALFKERGDNPVMVYGAQGAAENARGIKAFQEDESVRVAVAHPLAGGVGANFQKVCSDVIVLEPWTSPGDFVQAIARVQRSGQEHPVTVWLLSLLGTAFPAMIDTMMKRNAMAVEANGDLKTFMHYMQGGT